MDYRQSLETLRRSLFAEPEVQKPVKNTGFIPLRNTFPQEDSTDLASRPNEWLKQIKSAAAEIQDKEPKTSGGFAAGLADSLSTSIDKKIAAKKTATQESLDALPKKEVLIRRRGNLPSTYAPKPSDVATFQEAVDATEGAGNYDTLYSHSQKDGGNFAGTAVSKMTIGELKDFASPSGNYGQWVKAKIGRVATPMGRYQFVGTTLNEVADEMGLPDDTVFSPEVQDRMFNYYLDKKIASGKTMEDKIKKVRSGWEGFKNIPTVTLEKLIMERENK